MLTLPLLRDQLVDTLILIIAVKTLVYIASQATFNVQISFMTLHDDYRRS